MSNLLNIFLSSYFKDKFIYFINSIPFYLFFFYICVIYYGMLPFDVEYVIGCSSLIVFSTIITIDGRFFTESSTLARDYFWSIAFYHIKKIYAILPHFGRFFVALIMLRLSFLELWFYVFNILITSYCKFNYKFFELYFNCYVNYKLKYFLLLEFLNEKVFLENIWNFLNKETY